MVPNYIRTGPREHGTVVLLHGVGFDLTYWDRQIEALAPAYDVIALDLPGHGRSLAKPEFWTFPNITRTIADLIRMAGDAPVHLIGISFGGMIAQQVVLEHPSLVRSLTLIATAPSFPEPVRAGMRARAATTRSGGMQAVLTSSLERWLTAETRAKRPDLVDRITKTVLGDDPAIHAAIWELIADHFDVEARLGEIACPTLVLVGEQDQSTPPAVASRMAAAISGAKRTILPATSHMASIESPLAVNAEIEKHLRSFG